MGARGGHPGSRTGTSKGRKVGSRRYIWGQREPRDETTWAWRVGEGGAQPGVILCSM